MEKKDEKKDLRDSVLLNLRSVTQSCKGGVPFERLQRDYRDLLGTPIPFRELGYTTLEAFIRDIPDVISLRKNNEGQLVAEGVADAATAHIVSLVSRQKTDPRKLGRGAKRTGFRRGFNSRFASWGTGKSFHPNTNSSSFHQISTRNKNKPPRESNFISSQHSKSSPSVPPPKTEQVPPRKYEIAPRFLKLQQEQRTAETPIPELKSSPSHSASGSKKVNLHSNNVSNGNLSVAVVSSLVSSNITNPVRNTRRNKGRSAQLVALDSARSAKEFVDIYAKMNNISAVYCTILMGQKSKGFISSLTLGDKKYKSYPEVRHTEELAEEEAAKVAMAAIQESREHMARYPETPYSSAEQIQILLSRLEEIVCEKPSGMFTNGIIEEYEHKFNEALPSCWLDLLRQSSRLDVDNVDVPYGRVPEGVTVIVRPSKDLSSGNATPSSTSSKTEAGNDGLDLIALKTSLVKISTPKVPPIKIPDGNEWNVYISNINGSYSARLFEYSDQFLAMSQGMKNFYENSYYPPTEIFVHQLYAACASDWWHRVLIDEIKSDDEISCYFVDEGDFCCVKKEELQELSAEFYKLPFQAIQINLEGLEEYETFIKYEHLAERVLGKTLVGVVKRWWVATDFFPESTGVHRTVYSVILYDVNDDSDINLNEWLKSTVLADLICKLPELSTLSCAFLSHVTAEGHIFLRMTHPSQCWLEYELEKLYQVFEDSALETILIPLNAMCVAKDEDGKWRRAVVAGSLTVAFDARLVEMFFVDYGHSTVVRKCDVCVLEPINELLASLPHQAVRCELFEALPSPDAKWTAAASQKLIELAPLNEELMIRVFSESNSTGLAKVNLYKRNKDLVIISINHTLASCPELFQDPPASIKELIPLKIPSVLPLQPKTSLSSFIPDVAVPAEEHMARKIVGSVSASDHIDWMITPDNVKSPDGFEVQSAQSLSSPEIPNVGEMFDVFVTMAAHPHNFIVQPLKSCADLDNLMLEMQQFYSTDENFCEMHLSLLEENGFYAALHSDKSWYRVRLERIIAGDPVMAAVHYVDFGDFNTVSMSNLQPLYFKFRHLPCQAIKASLAGVKPSEKDWDPVECIKFKEMVTEKKFVAIVQGKVQQKKNFPSLELELVDTSDPDEDIFIHELLIVKQIAKPI